MKPAMSPLSVQVRAAYVVVLVVVHGFGLSP